MRFSNVIVSSLNRQLKEWSSIESFVLLEFKLAKDLRAAVVCFNSSYIEFHCVSPRKNHKTSTVPLGSAQNPQLRAVQLLAAVSVAWECLGGPLDFNLSCTWSVGIFGDDTFDEASAGVSQVKGDPQIIQY